MKKLVILLILLCAAGAAAWFIYREAPSGPEDKAVLYGNVDLRQVDLAFLISERIDSVLVDEGEVNGTGTIMQECIWMNYNPATQTQKLF